MFQEGIEQFFYFVTFYIYYGLVLIQLLLSCIVDENPVPPQDPTKVCFV